MPHSTTGQGSPVAISCCWSLVGKDWWTEEPRNWSAACEISEQFTLFPTVYLLPRQAPDYYSLRHIENLLSFQQLRWFPCNAQFVPPTVWLSGRLISIWVIPCLSDMVGNSSPDTIFSVVYQACSISSSPAASHLPPILFRNRLILTPLLFFNSYNLSFHVLNSIFPFFGPPLFLPQITHSFYLALLNLWSFEMQQIHL